MLLTSSVSLSTTIAHQLYSKDNIKKSSEIETSLLSKLQKRIFL